MKKIRIGEKKPTQVIHPEPVKQTHISQPKHTQNRDAAARKPHTKKKKKSLLPKALMVLIVLTLIGAGLFMNWRWRKNIGNSFGSGGERLANACTDILNPKCWTKAFKPQLKQENGKTNVLIVGIDTREGGSGSGLLNTDTIILATLDHQNKHTRMISFPRDLYAPYGCSADKQPYKTKINAIYAYGKIYCEDKDGMKVLSQTIEKITGEKVQYTVIIRLEGVIQAIDAMGGVEVDVPKDHTDVYPYVELPESFQKTCVRHRQLRAYCVFTFKKGKQQMDGQTALIYSRMRYLSSDFDRARRQQEVISAIKDKVISDETPVNEKANNLLNIYKSLGKNIEFDLDIETVLAALSLIGEVDSDPAGVIMDPAFGGGGLIVNGEGSNYNFRDYSFKQVQDKLKFIDANYDLYKERPKIYSVNQTGKPWEKDNPVMKIKNGGFWFMEVITDTKPVDATKSGVEIIDFTGGNAQKTIEKIKSDFGPNTTVTVTTATTENALTKSKYGEDVAVIIYSYNLSQETATQTQ